MNNVFSYYTKYREYIPEYNDWKNGNAQQDKVASNSSAIELNNESLKQKAQTIVNPLLIADCYEHEKAEDAETFQPQTEEYPPAAYPAGYGTPESEFRTPERHRILRTAAGEELSFYGTGAEHTEEKFPAEIPSHSPQENAMPEKKSDAQLSAAIGALTECARGQLRYLKKNYDLLKTQTEERYFN